MVRAVSGAGGRNHGPFGPGKWDGTGVGGLLVRRAGRAAAAEQAGPAPGHEHTLTHSIMPARAPGTRTGAQR